MKIMISDNPLVSRRARVFCAVGAVLFSIFGWFLTLVLAWGLISERTACHNGKPIWIGCVILGYFSFALSWFAIRLIARPLPTDGSSTMMPRWFLLFTIAFFAGCVLLTYVLK
ncbi:MAG: hypothetical protein MUC65_06185 [Pontiellaceae bacterium]|nr:hypothetical protein [Pontiellaceae bacterium]